MNALTKKDLVKRIENIALELQEHITLPVHAELRIKLFDLATEVRRIR